MAPHRNDQQQDHNPAHDEDDVENQDHISYYRRLDLTLLEMASAELEKIRLEEESDSKINLSSSLHLHHAFPSACLAVLKTLGGNNRCVDCGARDPQWAAVSYGAVLCLACSGRHRSLGVQVSVRTVVNGSVEIQSLNVLFIIVASGFVRAVNHHGQLVSRSDFGHARGWERSIENIF